MTESAIQAAIRAALGSDARVVLWRNSTGVAEHFARGSTQTVRYGLAKGSADLVGLVHTGRFLALEVKRPGEKARPEQVMWLELVRRMGGFAAVVTSVDEAKRAVDDACA